MSACCFWTVPKGLSPTSQTQSDGSHMGLRLNDDDALPMTFTVRCELRLMTVRRNDADPTPLHSLRELTELRDVSSHLLPDLMLGAGLLPLAQYQELL
jgi:hypothetical protein